MTCAWAKLVVAIAGFAGTVTVADPVTELKRQDISEVPAATPVTIPVAAPTVALAGVPLDHAQRIVRSFVVPSDHVPVPVNCCVAVGATTKELPVTVIDESDAVVNEIVLDPVCPRLSVAWIVGLTVAVPVGVPETRQDAMLKPAGNAPAVTTQLYGPTPPVTATRLEYGTFW